MQTQLVRPLPCCHTDGFLPFIQQRGAHILLKDHQNGFCQPFAIRTGFAIHSHQHSGQGYGSIFKEDQSLLYSSPHLWLSPHQNSPQMVLMQGSVCPIHSSEPFLPLSSHPEAGSAVFRSLFPQHPISCNQFVLFCLDCCQKNNGVV